MKLNDAFADCLKFYRERKGLSQDELARASDLDRTYISQLERGLKSPTLTTLDKLSSFLDVAPHKLLRHVRSDGAISVRADYHLAGCDKIEIKRDQASCEVSAGVLIEAIDEAHDLVDELYASDLDIATVLGMRNLSAFIGELFAAAIAKNNEELFRPNPHQDGYPDLLLMDRTGKDAWRKLKGRLNEKTPFSPFPSGGIEVKATCGSVPTPATCVKRGFNKPGIGDTRIDCMTGYDWKAHHRETNNLVGLLWDFIEKRPRIVAVFYSSALTDADWGQIVQPRKGGGKTTSVSIMNRQGILKMYSGWLCVIKDPRYAALLNHRNGMDLIPSKDG